MSREGNTAVATLETVVESVAKKLLHDVVVKAVINSVVTAIPLFGSSFFNPIITFIINKICMVVYDEAAVHGAFFTINIREDKKRQDYDQAVKDLRTALVGGTPSIEAIQKAKDEYKKRLSDLIRINS